MWWLVWMTTSVDLGGVAEAGAEPAGQVDQRLGLVFGRMLLGVGVQDGALRLTRRRQRHRVDGPRTAEQPGEHPVFPLIYGAGEPCPRIARSIASTATFPANAGA